MQSPASGVSAASLAGTGYRPTLVRVYYGGQPMGLYRLAEARDHDLWVSVSLSLGTLSFPVGTQLMVEDLHGVFATTAATRVPANVVENSGRTMPLVSTAAAGEPEGCHARQQADRHAR